MSDGVPRGVEGIQLEIDESADMFQSPAQHLKGHLPSNPEAAHSVATPPSQDLHSLSPFAQIQSSGPEFRPEDLATPPQLKPLRTLSILTDVEEEPRHHMALLIKWNVEPPRGSGMMKVLLEVSPS
jgi:hypothetical protein